MLIIMGTLGLFATVQSFDIEIRAFVSAAIYDPAYVMLACLAALGIPSGWIWWSLAVPKWKLWAYSRVENIKQLKREAVSEGLIWPDGHILEKTEICSKAMRREILRLEGRL
ncbi:hypothetical protein ABAC402_06420 [Asticcacaulis sp. AC402]|nr:hypothetical protein ABAC402_06420 [Asticcacaulis sp. AC402]